MREPLQECVRCEVVEGIDRENGIIRGVKLLGEQSKNPPPNNHEYPRSTREAAVSLLEGLGIYVDHGKRGSNEPRSYRDRMGLVKNVREKGDGVYGDWHFPPKHHLAEQAFWDAENAPQNLGFSINGNGDKSRAGGRVIVEAITDLESIDLVSRPATTNGLREGRERPMKKTIRELIESLKTRRPGYARALREEAEAGILSPDAMMDAPADEPAESEAKDHEQALRDAAKAVLDDDTMDHAEMVSRIKKILAILQGKKGGDGSATDTPTDTETEEARRKKAGNLLEVEALRALGRKGVKLTPLVEAAVRGCRTQQEVAALVESPDIQTTPARPGARSSAPTREQQTAALQEQRTGTQQQNTDTPEARAARVSAYRSRR